MKRFFTVTSEGTGGNENFDASIGKEKAQNYIHEKVKDVKLDEGQEKDVEMNLSPDNNLGQSPEDTLKGMVIAEKYGEDVRDRIKDFRVRIDSLYLTGKELDKLQFMRSRELSAAITAFQNARQHTGKLLSERGEPTVYKGEGAQERPQQGTVIDLGMVVSEHANENDKSSIAALKKFRDLAEEVIIDYAIFGNNMALTSYIETVSSMSVMKGLLDGKMWLGELLAIVAQRQML